MKDKTKFAKFLCGFLSVLVIYIAAPAAVVFAQDPTENDGDTATTRSVKPASIFQKFLREEVNQIKIETDLQELIALKLKPGQIPGKLRYSDAQGKKHEYDIKLETRSKSRRRICAFPPIKIDFSKKALRDNGLSERFDKLKLVTHCNGTDEDEQNLFKEFMTYGLYNYVTDASFLVKLVKIEYIDSKTPEGSMEHYAFLIEHKNEMAERLGGQVVEKYNIQRNELPAENYFPLTMFQYMIGNLDWKISTMHNIELVQLPDSTIIAVPFDFDYAGLVNSYYAKPNNNYQQVQVTDRIFIGELEEESQIKTCLAPLRAAKASMLSFCEDFKFLDRKYRKEMTKYLKSFFKMVEQDKLTLTTLFPPPEEEEEVNEDDPQ